MQLSKTWSAHTLACCFVLVVISPSLQIGLSLFEPCTSATRVEIRNLVAALKRSMGMFRCQEAESLLQDVTLSVRLVRANVLGAVHHLHRTCNESCSSIPQLESLLEILNDDFWEKIPKYVDDRVTSTVTWDKSAQAFKKDALEEIPLMLPEECDHEHLHNIMAWKGETFSEQLSDECLSQVVRSCDASDICWNVETDLHHLHGYATSHRLLFLQIFRNLGCQTNVSSSQLESLKRHLCQEMFNEARLMFECGAASDFTQDLFAEHVALCGLEGFSDFARSEWRALIMQLEDANPCYSKEGRYKRSEKMLKPGCFQHQTGVTAAAQAVHLRTLVALCHPESN